MAPCKQTQALPTQIVVWRGWGTIILKAHLDSRQARFAHFLTSHARILTSSAQHAASRAEVSQEIGVCDDVR